MGTVPRAPRAYPSDAVGGEGLVGPPLHLVAVAVRVEDLPAAQIGAGPQDDLLVPFQGAHPVLLLYAMAEHLPVMVRRHVGQAGVDGVRVILGFHRPGREEPYQ